MGRPAAAIEYGRRRHRLACKSLAVAQGPPLAAPPLAAAQRHRFHEIRIWRIACTVDGHCCPSYLFRHRTLPREQTSANKTILLGNIHVYTRIYVYLYRYVHAQSPILDFLAVFYPPLSFLSFCHHLLRVYICIQVMHLNYYTLRQFSPYLF